MLGAVTIAMTRRTAATTSLHCWKPLSACGGNSSNHRRSFMSTMPQMYDEDDSTTAATAATLVNSNGRSATSSSTATGQQPQQPQSQHNQSQFLLILGPPGGGKGTISGKMLADFPQFSHLSTGDMLREHVRRQTSLGREAQSYMSTGALVPDRLMIDLVMADATPVLEEGQSLLLDGFPRTLAQANALEKVTHIDVVVNLDVPTETIVERIADRWIHPASGRVYSYSYRPPAVYGKDDVTGEELVQRPDDRPEAVRARLEAYAAVTQPLVNFYQEQSSVLTATFAGTKSDEIYPRVKAFLDQATTKKTKHKDGHKVPSG